MHIKPVEAELAALWTCYSDFKKKRTGHNEQGKSYKLTLSEAVGENRRLLRAMLPPRLCCALSICTGWRASEGADLAEGISSQRRTGAPLPRFTRGLARRRRSIPLEYRPFF